MYTCPKGELIPQEALDTYSAFLQNCGVECGLSALNPEERTMIVAITTNHHPIRKIPNSIIALGFLNQTAKGGCRTEMFFCPTLSPESKRLVGIDITNRLLAAY